MKDEEGVVYLLHFDRWVGTPGKGGARHYMGWAKLTGLADRLKAHRCARTRVALMRALQRVGGDFELARVWWFETRAEERRRKQNGHIGELCPVCREATRAERENR